MDVIVVVCRHRWEMVGTQIALNWSTSEHDTYQIKKGPKIVPFWTFDGTWFVTMLANGTVMQTFLSIDY